jgi:uncharacterized protein YbjT (DUF2867 family)
MATYFVLGASGNVGSELSRLLEAAGHTVRRGSSRSTGPGQVRVDVVNGVGVAEALAGIDGAFLLAPPGYTNQDDLLGPVIDAAKAQGVGKVVLMTAMGADADPTSPMRKTELHLEASGLRWNVIRPNWFMQNFHTFWLHGIQTANAIQLPTGSAKGSFIDARDIAAVAAALLQRHEFDDRAFDLTGGESLDHDEVATLLSAALGRVIRYEDIAPEAMRPGLLAAGLPADYADFLLTILHYFKLGYAERITSAVQDITGRPPRRFADYAHDYRESYA